MVSADFIKSKVLEVGFSRCGIARCRNLSEHKLFLNNWLSSGFHSGLEYMTKYEDMRTDPSALLDGAKTVIVCAVNYKNNTIFDNSVVDNPRIASYALSADYHVTIKRMLAEVVASLAEHNPSLRSRTLTDTAPLLEKAWAVEAGLGWIGKNSLLVTREFGSLVLLGEILIDDEVDNYDAPFKESRCGDCRLCMESCPNGAIVSGMVVDTSRCISRLTIEKDTTEESQKSLHGWIFGCDICQKCCPYNAKTPLYSNPDFAPVVDVAALTREFWLAIDPARFKIMFGKTPISRTKLDAIQQRVILLSLQH